MKNAKYLVVRKSDQKVIGESYDDKLVQKIALAMEQRYAEEYEIVTGKAEKNYNYLDGETQQVEDQ